MVLAGDMVELDIADANSYSPYPKEELKYDVGVAADIIYNVSIGIAISVGV